jgi:hypothetical protein
MTMAKQDPTMQSRSPRADGAANMSADPRERRMEPSDRRRDRTPGAEEDQVRISVSVGKPLRARLRRMATEANTSASAVAFTLIREALTARDHKPRKTWGRPSQENNLRPGDSGRLMWEMPSLADVERTLAAIGPLVIDTITPPERRRRRRRRCCASFA